MPIVTELFKITPTDLDAKISARYKVLVTELVVSGVQCSAEITQPLTIVVESRV